MMDLSKNDIELLINACEIDDAETGGMEYDSNFRKLYYRLKHEYNRVDPLPQYRSLRDSAIQEMIRAFDRYAIKRLQRLETWDNEIEKWKSKHNEVLHYVVNNIELRVSKPTLKESILHLKSQNRGPFPRNFPSIPEKVFCEFTKNGLMIFEALEQPRMVMAYPILATSYYILGDKYNCNFYKIRMVKEWARNRSSMSQLLAKEKKYSDLLLKGNDG